MLKIGKKNWDNNLAHNLGIINFKIAIFKMFGTMLTTTGYNDLAILSSIVPPLALVLVSYIETPFSHNEQLLCCSRSREIYSWFLELYNKMPNYMLIPDCVVGELNALWNTTSISVLVLRVAPFFQEVDHFTPLICKSIIGNEKD